MVLRPLAELGHFPRHRVCAAAGELGLSERHTYRLIQRLREADGALTALRLMRVVGVRLLIVDEVRNLLGAIARRQRELLNLLRFLGNELHILLVCSRMGTKR